MGKRGKRSRKGGLQGRNIVHEFEQYFGDESKLENWIRMCNDLQLEGEFKSLNKCRTALAAVWVNIWDFIDALATNTTFSKFLTQKALAEYTIKNNKIYPRKHAKELAPVRALLAHIRSYDN